MASRRRAIAAGARDLEADGVVGEIDGQGGGLHRRDRGHHAVVALEAGEAIMLAGVAGNRQGHRAFRRTDDGGVTLDRPSHRGPRRALTVAQAAGLADLIEPLQ